MPIWRTKPVQDEPEITLTNWRIFQTEEGDRHFVGATQGFGGGRVSSAIIELDCASRAGVTATGRTYLLVGPPGFDINAEYVWDAWLRINRIASVRDVTLELFGTESTWT